MNGKSIQIFLFFFMGIGAFFFFAVAGISDQITYDLSSSWKGNIRMTGEDYADEAGYDLAVGDIDNDGTDDILVSAPFADPPGGGQAGKAYVIWGNPDFSREGRTDFNFSTDADIEILGRVESGYMGSMVRIDDVNGDDFGDIILGAPMVSTGSRTNNGEIYIIYGDTKGSMKSSYDLSQAGDRDVIIKGANDNDQLGSAFAAGDVNGGGTADLILGVPFADTEGNDNAGKVYVIYGGGLQADIDLASSSEYDVLVIGEPGDRMGTSVATGQVDDSGPVDIIIGAPYHDPGSQEKYPGVTYVIFGSGSLPATWDVSDTPPDVRIIGSSANRNSGHTVTSGDLNRDGIEEIIIGAPRGSGSNPRVFVVYGREDFAPPDTVDLNEPDPLAGFSVTSNIPDENSAGASISVFDFNDDGAGDLVLGSPSSAGDRGKLYILEGSIYLDESASYSFDNCQYAVLGEASQGLLGTSVGGGDVNNQSGENLQDIIVGAPLGNDGKEGVVYVIFGGLPYAADHYPEKGAFNVPVDANISFTLWDEDPGIDIDAVEVKVGGNWYRKNDPEFTYEAGSDSVRITIATESDFNYSEPVNIEIKAYDQADSPYQMPAERYSFTVVVDTDTPYIVNWNPLCESQGIPLKTDIGFTVMDNLSGVDSSSIDLFVTRQNRFDPDTVTVPGLIRIDKYSEKGFNVLFDPWGADTTVFNLGDTVNIFVDAKDLATPQNELWDRSCSFITVDDDTNPPNLYPTGPGAGDTGVSPKESIRFSVLDDETEANETGVNMTTIWLSVNGEVITMPWDDPDSSMVTVTESASDLGYDVLYNPIEYFEYGGMVTVRVQADDFAYPTPNHLDESYEFHTVDDLNPPYATDFYPAEGDTAGRNTGVTFKVLDKLSGVDPDSLLITIPVLEDTFTIADDDEVFDYIEDVGGVGYTFRYQPEEVFPETLITFTIHAADQAATPNILDRTYSFWTITDTLPPYLSGRDPYPEERNNPKNTSITFELWDELTGLELTSMAFRVKRVDQTSKLICSPAETLLYDGFNVKGIKYTYVPEEDFTPSEVVLVEIRAQDKAERINLMTEMYTFYIEYSGPVNRAVPPTITPNGDGYADNCLIYQVDPLLGLRGEVKIFNQRGELIWEDDKIPAQWWGKDMSGRTVPGGLYIYQIELKGKVYHGTIVVAR